MMFKSYLIYCLLILNTALFAQAPSIKINWKSPSSIQLSETKTLQVLSFEDATYSFDDNNLPRFNQKVTLPDNEQSFTSTLVNAVYETLSDVESKIINNNNKIESQITLSSTVVIVKKVPHGVVSFIPIRKNSATGKYEKLISFTLINTPSGQYKITGRAVHSYASGSVLQTGKWYKVGVTAD